MSDQTTNISQAGPSIQGCNAVKKKKPSEVFEKWMNRKYAGPLYLYDFNNIDMKDVFDRGVKFGRTGR